MTWSFTKLTHNYKEDEHRIYQALKAIFDITENSWMMIVGDDAASESTEIKSEGCAVTPRVYFNYPKSQRYMDIRKSMYLFEHVEKLGEEAAELAAAAIKLSAFLRSSRTIPGRPHIPWEEYDDKKSLIRDYHTLYGHLLEEFSDVLGLMYSTMHYAGTIDMDDDFMLEMDKYKQHRILERISAGSAISGSAAKPNYHLWADLHYD